MTTSHAAGPRDGTDSGELHDPDSQGTPTPGGSRLVATLRWVAILTAFLAATEVFARLDDAITWGAPILSAYSNDRLLQQDSLGFVGRRNYRFQKWRMNNLGFRGPDVTPLPAPGVTRIAVVGASETFGLYESEGGEYPARMQRLLDSLAPGRFEVVNAGLPGLSLASMVPYFRRAILPTGASILVIYPSPPFYLEVQPLPLDYTPPRWRPTPVWALLGHELDPSLFQLRIGGKSRDVLKELIPSSVVTLVRERGLTRRRASHPPEWVWRVVPEDRMQTLRVHLQRLVSSVQAAGVTTMVITHANRFEGAMQDTSGPDRRHVINLMSLYYPQATAQVLVATDSIANLAIRQIAGAAGAAVVDAEGQIPPSPKYFADFLHFTDAGADRMARLVVEKILATAGTLSAAPASALQP